MQALRSVLVAGSLVALGLMIGVPAVSACTGTDIEGTCVTHSGDPTQGSVGVDVNHNIQVAGIQILYVGACVGVNESCPDTP